MEDKLIGDRNKIKKYFINKYPGKRSALGIKEITEIRDWVMGKRDELGSDSEQEDIYKKVVPIDELLAYKGMHFH